MESKKVSVIMPAYNAERYIEIAIQSVIEQSYSNWELIIVNDGSTDSTSKILSRMVRNDERIRVHNFDENRGACGALNQALDMVTGDYVCWLSADDTYLKDMFASSIKYLNENGKVQGVFSKHYFIDERGDKIGEHCFDEKYDGIGNEDCVEPYYSMLFSGNMFCASTMFAYTEVFRKVGYFNERHQYAGDYEYMLRLCSVARVGYLDKFNMQSRVHSQQVTAQGYNGGDEIESFYEMLFNETVRHGLLEKAGVIDCRYNLLEMFHNRANSYNIYGKNYRLIIDKEKEFLSEFPEIINADKYTNQVIGAINRMDYLYAKHLIQNASEEMLKWVDINIWFILCASVFQVEGRIKEAEDILIRAIEFDSKNYEAQLMLAEICIERNEWNQAIRFLEQAYEGSSDNIEDHNLVGERLKSIKEAEIKELVV